MPVTPTQLAILKTAFDNARTAYLAAEATYNATIPNSLAGVHSLRTLRNTLEGAQYQYAVAFAAIYEPAQRFLRLLPVPVPPPTLDDVPGMKLRLEADSGTTVDGSNHVLTWADQSGSGNNAVAGVNPFTLTTNVFGVHPGLVSATGGDLVSATATDVFTSAHARTVYVVANVTHCDAGCVFISFRKPIVASGFSNFSLGLWNATNSGTVYPYTDANARSESVATSPASFESANHIFAYRFSGSGNIEFAVDGGAFAALTGSAFLNENGPAGYRIGRFTGFSTIGDLRGKIGTIVAYDSALSAPDDAVVRGVLGAKYGITV